MNESTKPNIAKDKSYAFALRIIKLRIFLNMRKKEFVLSNQVLRSGTAVGALLREAEHAESKPDFLHKISIALKEANETLYWLDLLFDSHYISGKSADSLREECTELVKILAATVKTLKA